MAASQKERSTNDRNDIRGAGIGMEGSDIEHEQHSPSNDERVGGGDINRDTSSTADSSYVAASAQKSNTHNTVPLVTNTESDRSKVPKAEAYREETVIVPINNVGLSSVESVTAFSTPFPSPSQPIGTSSVSTKGANSGEVAYSSVGRMVGGNVAGEAVWQPVIPVVTSQSSSSTCSLSKALIENERKREKERLTKQNRLSKVCLSSSPTSHRKLFQFYIDLNLIQHLFKFNSTSIKSYVTYIFV